jgi:hypothetical protein
MLNARLTMVGKLLAAVLLFGPGPSQGQVDCNTNAIDDPRGLSCRPRGGACEVHGYGLSADGNNNGVPPSGGLPP